jgi:hypothetical protein
MSRRIFTPDNTNRWIVESVHETSFYKEILPHPYGKKERDLDSTASSRPYAPEAHAALLRLIAACSPALLP